jgi:mRNA interferase MazF
VKRGELYRLYKGTTRDPKSSRVFVVVSRQVLIDSRFSTVVWVYSAHHGLSTQVEVGVDDGLKHSSSIYCDELVSIPKSKLTDYIGLLPASKLTLLDAALKNALDLT